MAMRVLVVNGPNLNLLGQREPDVYGASTLADAEQRCAAVAGELDCELTWVQSNREGDLVDAVQSAAGSADALIVNAAGYTHTSVALRDALAAVALPFVEVHVSNVFARDAFRHHSYLSDLASGVIVGCGIQGYELALRRLADLG